MEGKKTCTKCDDEKPIGQFRKNPRYRGGRASWCLGCASDYARFSYLSNKDKILEKQKAYYQANKAKRNAFSSTYRGKNLDKVKAYEAKSKEKHKATYQELARKFYRKNRARLLISGRRRALAQKYNMSEEEYDRKFAEQSGLCATCLKPPKANKRLCVDHDHVTGRVRRLLCDRCNMVLGLIDESPSTLRRLADYLEEFQAIVATLAETAGSAE